MFKISVIIPTYNDEEYLTECIEHVITQTIGFDENIQLIFVDDNSKDKTVEIIEQYKQKYPNNIIMKKLEENSGSGGKPRNIGINLATGKYLMFSDADDFFDVKAFEIMYNAIENKKCDFIIANWNYANENGTPWDKPVFDLERFNDFKLSINDKDSFWVMNSSMCNKIFNREFIIKNEIKCLENVPGEDTYFSMKAFLNAKEVYYIKDIIYYYRQRNSTDNTVSTSWNCSKDFFLGMNTAYKEIFNLFVEKKQIQFYRFLYARNMTYLLYRFVDSYRLTYDDRVYLLGEMRWFFKLIVTLKVPPVQKTLSILLKDIIEGEYASAIDVCKIIAELRTYLPKNIKNSLSKPYEEMYNEILKTEVNIDDI